VTIQITGRKTTVIAVMKYQLPAMFASYPGTSASAEDSVIPKRSASS
jgi:hypothetical protein